MSTFPPLADNLAAKGASERTEIGDHQPPACGPRRPVFGFMISAGTSCTAMAKRGSDLASISTAATVR